MEDVTELSDYEWISGYSDSAELPKTGSETSDISYVGKSIEKVSRAVLCT